MDKELITRNFSRYAYTYDKYADVQKLAASQLIRLARKTNIDKILEIGYGTGNYTILLREKFADAKIKALDLSDKMMEVACAKIRCKAIEFMVEDGEALDWDEDFNLITSNACFQWFEDLDGALKKYKGLLNKDGFILFSVFGPRTFWELNVSLKSIFKETSVSSVNFLEKERLRNILNKNFGRIELKEIAYEESFSCLSGLLKKIKYSGTNGFGSGKKILLTPQILKKLEKSYLDNFGRIKATYQVFFCRGEK